MEGVVIVELERVEVIVARGLRRGRAERQQSPSDPSFLSPSALSPACPGAAAKSPSRAD